VRTGIASSDPFTANKRKVREMDLKLIERHFGGQEGNVRYFGLPGIALVDVLYWRKYLGHVTAVERGRPSEEYLYQHDMVLTAMLSGLGSSLSLLRGDLDSVLIDGHDDFGNQIAYPFHLVCLDYSGGIIYRNSVGRSKRADSIEALLRAQAEREQSFLLLVSCNLDNEDRGEIHGVFPVIEAQLLKLGIGAAAAVQAYLDHEDEEARLKVFVPYLIQKLASRWFQCQHYKPIYYEGNKSTRMMHFPTWLKRTTGLVVGKPSRQSLADILNLRAFHCVGGDLAETDFGIPRVSPTAPW
jgi:hypothetical protein